MKKGYFLISIIFFLITLMSCSTTANRGNEDSLKDLNLSLMEISTYPDNVFVGISGYHSTEKKMVKAAIVNCAENVLINEFVALRVLSYSHTNQSYIKFDSEDHISYKDDSFDEVIDALEILEISFDKALGCIVVARDIRKKANKRPFDISYNSINKPSWINNPPESSSYVVGIGVSGNYSTIRKSIFAADFNAVEELFSQFADSDSFVIHQQNEIRTDNYNKYYDDSYQGNIGILEGVQILSRWYDEINNKYYSLAIIKKK